MKNKVLTFTLLGTLISLIAGISVAVALTLLKKEPEPNLAVGGVYAVTTGLLLVTFIVEIVSMIKIDDSTFHTALLAGCLFVLYFCSTDMQLFFAAFDIHIPKAVFGIISELAFIFTAVGCCWYIIFMYQLPINKKLIVSIAVPILAALLAGYAVAIFYGYGYIAHFILVIMLLSAFCTLLANSVKKRKLGLTTYFTVAAFCLSMGAQSVNALFYNGSTIGVQGISLAYAAATVAMFLCVYLMFSILADGKALMSDAYKEKAELFETKALSGQIKPHFIFNSLEAVRTLYHRDIASGDAAVNLLSEFLRGSIQSFDSELIPFETEIDNVFSYAEFENLKRQKKIEVIFNIDFTEFSVPPFSVQPFVENALKYSGVDEIENGSIIISSYKKGDCAVVEIVDNGKGFDVSNVSESSHGIRNASGRFALTLGTVPEIKSEIGKGTRVKIVIDLTKQGASNK